MALNKKDLFPESDLLLADFARTLGHPARIAILRELAKREECICGELVSELPLAQSTVSQHLKELKKAGLIKGNVSGVKSCYCINWENFERIAGLFNQLTTKISESNQEANCC